MADTIEELEELDKLADRLCAPIRRAGAKRPHKITYWMIANKVSKDARCARYVGLSKHGSRLAWEVIFRLTPYRVRVPFEESAAIRRENDFRKWLKANDGRGVWMRYTYDDNSVVYRFGDDQTAALFRLNFE